MKAVVTGGAGFIGSCLARRLLHEGMEVKIIDDFSTGRMENVTEIKKTIKIVKGDVTNLPLIKKELKDAEFVFHLAAIASVQDSIRDPLKSNRVNVNGTLNVLMAAKENNVKRVIFSSSAAVYGDDPKLPKREDSVLKPMSLYAASKLAGEHYCKLFSQLYGLDTACLRYFNVYGERQNPDSEYAAVIPKFMRLMLQNKQPMIFGDGKQTRDFVHVSDVARANIMAMKAKKLGGEPVNIASGKSIDLLQLIYQINKALGTKLKPVFQPAKQGDIRNSLADISKAIRILGWMPETSFRNGLISAKPQ